MAKRTTSDYAALHLQGIVRVHDAAPPARPAATDGAPLVPRTFSAERPGQRAVPVLDDDTPETLAQRVFAAESEAYPEAIRLFAEGRLHIDGRRVRIR
jgi:folate-dependent phosphoribosylglycinamide formyltransferase PurN